MARLSKTNILMVFTVSILIFSALNFSGCLGDEEEGVVGIPEGEDPEGDVHDDYVEVSVPIMNTYEEPKQIVMKFEIGTEEGGRYSERKFLTLPKDSVEVYSQVVEIPENETADYVDTGIIVSEDEIKIVEVRGEASEGAAVVNATVANTKFESERLLFEFIVTTENNVYREKKGIDVSESSMDLYTEDVEIPPDETAMDFDVQII